MDLGTRDLAEVIEPRGRGEQGSPAPALIYRLPEVILNFRKIMVRLITTLTVSGLLVGFIGCVMDSPDPVHAIYQGYSMKESTSVHIRINPENPADTLYDTVRILKSYPADSMLFHFSSKRRANGSAEVVYTESFFFVLPSGTSEFHYPANILSKSKLFFINSCAQGCGLKTVESGALKGSLTVDLHYIEGGVFYTDQTPSVSTGETGVSRGLDVSGTYRVTTKPPPL